MVNFKINPDVDPAKAYRILRGLVKPSLVVPDGVIELPDVVPTRQLDKLTLIGTFEGMPALSPERHKPRKVAQLRLGKKANASMIRSILNLTNAETLGRNVSREQTVYIVVNDRLDRLAKALRGCDDYELTYA